MNAEIISIGDELLIGQVVNTNASVMGKMLSGIGLNLQRVTTVGDSEKIILKAIRSAWKECDVVIVTGGLGPTHDDISKAVVAKFFKKEMALDEATLGHIKKRFKRFGYKVMPPSNIGQAMVPDDFVPLRNDVGTAPGLLYHDEGKTFVILPGVPMEMEWLMNKWVLPFLRKTYAHAGLEVIEHHTLLTTGIGESALAEKIGDISKLLRSNETLAFLPRSTGVRLRISVKTKSEAEAKKSIARIGKHITTRAGAYIYGTDDVTLEEMILTQLTAMKRTLATAESCTGGLISAQLTEIPGASSAFVGGIVSYDNSVKIKELGVKPATLKKFGAVSEQCAREMAEGVLARLGTDYALSVTGIAGPDGGTKEKPVGTIWIALAEKGKPSTTKLVQYAMDRKMNRERAAAAALEMLRKRLMGLE